MDTSTIAEVIGLLVEIRNTLVALREDLKRRSERDLKAEGRIPGGQSSAPANTAAGLCFPNYGRAKNQPVSGASRGDLDFYAGGCRRTLDDPAKSRWHDKERDLLAAIEAEIAKQSGGAPTSTGGFGDEDPLPF